MWINYKRYDDVAPLNSGCPLPRAGVAHAFEHVNVFTLTALTALTSLTTALIRLESYEVDF